MTEDGRFQCLLRPENEAYRKLYSCVEPDNRGQSRRLRSTTKRKIIEGETVVGWPCDMDDCDKEELLGDTFTNLTADANTQLDKAVFVFESDNKTTFKIVNPTRSNVPRKFQCGAIYESGYCEGTTYEVDIEYQPKLIDPDGKEFACEANGSTTVYYTKGKSKQLHCKHTDSEPKVQSMIFIDPDGESQSDAYEDKKLSLTLKNVQDDVTYRCEAKYRDKTCKLEYKLVQRKGQPTPKVTMLESYPIAEVEIELDSSSKYKSYVKVKVDFKHCGSDSKCQKAQLVNSTVIAPKPVKDRLILKEKLRDLTKGDWYQVEVVPVECSCDDPKKIIFRATSGGHIPRSSSLLVVFALLLFVRL